MNMLKNWRLKRTMLKPCCWELEILSVTITSNLIYKFVFKKSIHNLLGSPFTIKYWRITSFWVKKKAHRSFCRCDGGTGWLAMQYHVRRGWWFVFLLVFSSWASLLCLHGKVCSGCRRSLVAWETSLASLASTKPSPATSTDMLKRQRKQQRRQ